MLVGGGGACKGKAAPLVGHTSFLFLFFMSLFLRKHGFDLIILLCI